MLYLIVFGGLLLLLSVFYLINSMRTYHQWKVPSVLILISLVMVAYGVIKLPQAQHNRQADNSSKVMANRKPLSNQDSNVMTKVNSHPKVTQNQKEMFTLKQLQKAYGKLGSVGFDEKTNTFQIDVVDNDTKNELNALSQDPSRASQIGWPKLTDSVKQTSDQISQDKVLGKGYSISIMNPSQAGKALYTAKDGQQIYNVAGSN